MAQFSRPDTDDSVGLWRTQSGGASGLWAGIDEPAFDFDTMYIVSNWYTSFIESFYIAGLSTVTDPVSSANHVMRYSFERNDQGGGSPPTMDLTVELRQGTTVIATRTHNDIDLDTKVEQTETLTTGETDSITNYSDLNVKIIGHKSAGARDSRVRIYVFEFEVPNAGGVSRRIFNIT